MKLYFHNKIEIIYNNNTYTYYNSMLDSIYQKIANLESFCDKLAIGSGNTPDIFSSFKLNNFITFTNLTTETLQNDVSESEIFIKKIASIDTSKITSRYITEAGITSNSDDESNPTLYNYFSFINENTPNGIEVNNNEPISLSIYIYLDLTSSSVGLFTKGNNPFIEFLLGNGLNNKKIYIARGSDNSDNILIARSNDYEDTKYECSLSYTIDNGLQIKFTGDLGVGETFELVFFANDIAFARINTNVIQPTYSLTESYTPKRNYVVDLGKGIIEVSSIVNETTATEESDIYLVKYATNFASKTVLPFNNLFDINTPRFLSRDGDKLFFLLNDYIYMYQNINHQLIQVLSINLQIQNIIKITSFDDFVFVFSTNEPFIYPYKIKDNTLVACTLDITAFPYHSNLSGYTEADIVESKDGTFLLGFIIPINTTTAYTLYFTFNESTNTFIYNIYVSTDDLNFTYILPFHKNNFSDAEMWYLQAGATTTKCKRVIHHLNRSITSNYTNFAYQLTKYTTSLKVKTRGVVVEKDANSSQNFFLYYFPQIYNINLDIYKILSKFYISNNLLYLIELKTDGSYHPYNMVGYDVLSEFSKGMPKDLDTSKILYIEFLIDIVLFFMDDENEPIVAYSLNDDSYCIENVSTNEDSYSVSLTRKKILGATNEGVSATLAVDITI